MIVSLLPLVVNEPTLLPVFDELCHPCQMTWVMNQLAMITGSVEKGKTTGSERKHELTDLFRQSSNGASSPGRMLRVQEL